MPTNDPAAERPRSDSEHSMSISALTHGMTHPRRRTADYLTMSRSIDAAGARADAATTLATLGTSPTFFANLD